MVKSDCIRMTHFFTKIDYLQCYQVLVILPYVKSSKPGRINKVGNLLKISRFVHLMKTMQIHDF